MKILDGYILRKFYTTLIYMVMLLSAIFVVIDITQKYTQISENNFTLWDALTQFYPFYLVWAINTFFSILVFISVLFFTSRMANNSEIVAIISSGISFYRFSWPYFLGAGIITLFALILNHFLLPEANIKKNEFQSQILNQRNKNEYMQSQKIASQMAPNEFLFINSYSRVTKNGKYMMYQKFDSLNKLAYELSANDLIWSDTDTSYHLTNYRERFVRPGKPDSLISGTRLKQKFPYTPDELLPEAYVAETMTTPELEKFIQREKVKGSGNINTYLFELYQRTSMPVSVIILTILALSLSSQKRRGGIGLNLAIGITIAFAFIFSFQMLSVMTAKGGFNPLLAAWLPNIVFGLLATFLYLRRATA